MGQSGREPKKKTTWYGRKHSCFTFDKLMTKWRSQIHNFQKRQIFTPIASRQRRCLSLIPSPEPIRQRCAKDAERTFKVQHSPENKHFKNAEFNRNRMFQERESQCQSEMMQNKKKWPSSRLLNERSQKKVDCIFYADIRFRSPVATSLKVFNFETASGPKTASTNSRCIELMVFKITVASLLGQFISFNVLLTI